MNEILGDHNVDKQMTDSRADVRLLKCSMKWKVAIANN